MASKIGFIGSCLCLLVSVLLIRTFFLLPIHRVSEPCRSTDSDFISVSEGSVRVKRFQEALRFQTISWEIGHQNTEELEKFRDFIIKSFPTIHSSPLVDYEVVANLSLLYKVKGSDVTLTPYMLMAHMDVVPTTDQTWDFDPFAADIVDGYVGARGAIDDKHCAMGILEAVEYILETGKQPKRTFYIALGHDEEIMGWSGAYKISQLLHQRAVWFEYILDEGLTVTDAIFPGVDKSVGIVGTSEKGFVNVKLAVEDEKGGHSSMPTHESCIGILSNAISRIESSPLPSQFGNGPEAATMEYAAPHMKFPLRVVMSNLWLFGPVVSWVMSQKPTTNAMIRTTTAVTMVKGGVKMNVIPMEATAVINHRIHPAQTVDEVVELDRKIINDPRVKVTLLEGIEPLKQSPHGDDVFGFQILKQTMEQIWSYRDIVVVPGLMIGATDTKHMMKLSDNVYRFAPTTLHASNTTMFHGPNERISIRNYEEAINFYYHLIRNSDAPQLQHLHKHSAEL